MSAGWKTASSISSITCRSWKWRHAVIALDDVSPDFARRVERKDVVFESLRKPPGHLFGQYPTLVRLFRRLRPAIVHTRNLAALEAMPPAWLAGVTGRVHGEHGWDVHDLDGTSSRYRRMRRVFRPFVQHYVALSDQIASYLQAGVGIDPRRVTRIYNGVDTTRFRPAGSRACRALLPFSGSDLFVVGTVGRLQAVKDQVSLVRAFAQLVRESGAERSSTASCHRWRRSMSALNWRKRFARKDWRESHGSPAGETMWLS